MEQTGKNSIVSKNLLVEAQRTAPSSVFRLLTYAFFIAALVVGLALRLVSMANKQTWEQDESISMLMATGHLTEYSNTHGDDRYPFLVWSSGADWKRFTTIEQPFAFARLAYEIGDRDDHPPLYFWLLHVWILLVGVHSWTGSALNLLLTIPLVIILARFGRATLGTLSLALVTAAIWMLRPMPVETMLVARHYILFALVAVLYAYAVWRILYPRGSLRLSPLQFLLLVLVAAAGLLTHYYFPLVVAAGCLALVLRYGLSRRLWMLLLSTVGALVIFVALHPNFVTTWAKVPERKRTDFELAQLDDRVLGIVNQTIGMFFDNLSVSFGVTSYSRLLLPALVVLIVLLALGYVAYRRRARLREFARRAAASEAAQNLVYLWVYIVVVTGSIYLLYVTFVSPGHAITARYVNMPWVFLAFVPALLTRLFRERWRTLAQAALAVYCAGILISALDTTLKGGINLFTVSPVAPAGTLSEYNTLVLDNSFRELMIPVSLHLDPDDRVFAAEQDTLLANPDMWLTPLAERGGLYVTVTDQRGGTPERRDALIALMRERGLTVTRAIAPWFFETYTVQP